MRFDSELMRPFVGNMQHGDGNVIKHAAVGTSGDWVLPGTVKQIAWHHQGFLHNEISNVSFSQPQSAFIIEHQGKAVPVTGLEGP
jgi:hypothetical protein